MEDNRKRILKIVKNNIVNKLKGRGSSLQEQKELLNKELSRNSSLFLNSDMDKEVAKEKRNFILLILSELEWSIDVAEEHLELLDGVVVGKLDRPRNPLSVGEIKLSREKMKHFVNDYEKSVLKLQKEIKEILTQDFEERKFIPLHERLWETQSNTGSHWKKEEINFVVEKHKMGYTFKAIATILKRPERTVRLKYHSCK